MSKSKPAIHDFFRCYRPKNETHELAIAQFCAQRRFVVSIDATPDKRLPVTYEEFRQWFETDTPRRGDVVNLVGQGISGIVETVGVNQSVCLYVSIRGDELDVASGCFDYTSLEIADKETVLRLQRALYREGLVWNRWRNRLRPRETPKENVQYQISVLGQKIGYGVFREIDAKGRIVMYCMKLEDGPVRYSLREVVGPAELAKELGKAGVLWNGFYKRIEPVNYLAPAGKGYYYLDEFWEVCRTIEQGKTKGAKYFNNGNYSRYREPMEELRRYLLNELGVGPVSRSEESVYYYLKEVWKVCRTTDKGRRRDIKRARSGNYSTDEASIRELALQLQEKRKEQLSRYPLKG